MARIDDIERRLAALEARSAEAPPAPSGDAFWALQGLTRDLPEGEGAVLFTGVVTVGDDPVSWQYAVPTKAVDGIEWADLAGAFAALGSPVRLTLLQRVMSGVHDVSDLVAMEGIGTSGQVYHHLRALVAAGWLRALGRARYEVPPNRVVPLYVCLVAGGDL